MQQGSNTERPQFNSLGRWRCQTQTIWKRELDTCVYLLLACLSTWRKTLPHFSEMWGGLKLDSETKYKTVTASGVRWFIYKPNLCIQTTRLNPLALTLNSKCGEHNNEGNGGKKPSGWGSRVQPALQVSIYRDCRVPVTIKQHSHVDSVCLDTNSVCVHPSSPTLQGFKAWLMSASEINKDWNCIWMLANKADGRLHVAETVGIIVEGFSLFTKVGIRQSEGLQGAGWKR